VYGKVSGVAAKVIGVRLSYTKKKRKPLAVVLPDGTIEFSENWSPK
jgi:hypothetical protein